MKSLKRMIDCFGLSVRLTEERYEHILGHPEMTGMEARMEYALLQPQFVRRSRSDPEVGLFYAFQEQTMVGSKWLCVVVKYLPDDAFIVTAYLTDQPKQGETLWIKE